MLIPVYPVSDVTLYMQLILQLRFIVIWYVYKSLLVLLFVFFIVNMLAANLWFF